MSRIIKIFLLISINAFFNYCFAVPINFNISSSASNQISLPSIGSIDRSMIITEEEKRLGQKFMQKLADKHKIIQDYDMEDYINNLGNTLVSYSPKSNQQFNFYVLNEKDINAFAIPGNYICINNGLIYSAKSEAELVSVIAHEISHITQEHFIRQNATANRDAWITAAGFLAGILLASSGYNNAGVALMEGAPAIAIQNQLSYSREFEREADRIGQGIMSSAGFDPYAMPRFFQTLQSQSRFNNSSEENTFLRTHPVTIERISEAQTRAKQLPTKMYPDSIGFLLIREKSRIREIGVKKSVKFYQMALKQKRYVSLDAQLYGLAFAYYELNQINNTLANLDKITDIATKNHPAVISLYAHALVKLKKYNLAESKYNDGLKQYPNYKGLWTGQIETYLASRQLQQALKYTENLQRIYSHDINLWQYLANICSEKNLNLPQKYHYALAMIDYKTHKYKKSLVQFQRALDIKTTKKDPVIDSIITAKIIEITRLINQKQNKL